MSPSLRLNLDLDQMRACIGLWRESLMIREAREVDSEERRMALTRINGVLDGWLDLLRLCNAEGSDQELFAGIMRDVVAFREWTHQAEIAISVLAGANNTRPIN